jgi:hypothetical protein
MTSAPFVVITSIHPPTEAVRAFAARVGERLVVVGDRKSPPDWTLPPATYLAAGADTGRGELAPMLPWDHYCRKMLGYLHAVRRGAEVIYDTDDDNAPKARWHVPPFTGTWDTTTADAGWVNVYRLFTDAHIWPRGFPLQRIARDAPPPLLLSAAAPASIGVWQALADGDPDVDAIYRLVDGRPCHFGEREPVVLAPGTLCPFNSQATAFTQSCFPLLYLPTSVTSRVTDILRGLVAQPILWAAGLRLGFTQATVLQERNPHDLLRDFEAEIPLYLHTASIVDAIVDVVRPGAPLADNLLAAYDTLAGAGVVDATEPLRVQAWLRDLAEAG